MDNITHSLAGWALGQTGLKNKTRKGLAALILGANAPDIDVFLSWVNWIPLATHRGFTHSLFGGFLLLPPLLAILLYVLDRWQLRRGAQFKAERPMHFGWLLALCFCGTLTHPLLDLQTVYAVQLLSPVSNHWFHTDTLFIIDWVLLLAMGIGICLSRKREKHGGQWRRPAIAAMIILLIYILANAGISQLAKQAIQRDAPDAYKNHDLVVASPDPFFFWRREIVWRQNRQIGWAKYDPLVHPSRTDTISPMLADNMNYPVVKRAAIANADIREFLRWSILPFATVAADGCDTVITFADARYTDPRASGNFTRRVVLKGKCANIGT